MHDPLSTSVLELTEQEKKTVKKLLRRLDVWFAIETVLLTIFLAVLLFTVLFRFVWPMIEKLF